MATVPIPEPDYGPVESPQPTVPPRELPPMPGDVDVPEPGLETFIAHWPASLCVRNARSRGTR